MAINEAVNIDIDVNGVNTVKEAANAYEDLGEAVSETQREAERLAQQFGINDDRTQEAIRTAGKYKQQLEELDFAIDGARGGSARLTGAVQGIVAGFEAASAAAVLLGVESQDLEKVLVRLTATMALAQAIRDLDEYKASLKDATNYINRTAIKAFTELSLAAQGIVVAGVALVLYAIYEALQNLNNETLKAMRLRESMAIINNNLNESFLKEKEAIGGLQEVAADETQTKQNRINAIRQIQQQYPDYLKNIDLEKVTTEDIYTANKNLNEELLRKAKLQAALERLGKISKDELDAQLLLNQALQDESDLRFSTQQMTPEEVRQRQTEIDQRKAIAQVLVEAAKADKDAILDYINTNDLKIESVKNAGDEVVKLDKKIKETNQETQDLQGQTIEGVTTTADASMRVIDTTLGYVEGRQKTAFERAKLFVGAYGEDIKNTFQDTLSVIGALSNAFAGEDEARQKKAFETNKRLAIVQATIGTIEATVNAYKEAKKNPLDAATAGAYSVAQALIAASFGLAQVQQIRSQEFTGATDFNPQGGQGGGAFGQSLNAPAVRLPRTEQFTGQQRIYVTEYDISNTQEKVKVTEDVSIVK